MVNIVIGGFGAESNAFSIEKPGDESTSIVSGENLIREHLEKKTVIGGFLDVLDFEEVRALPASRIYWGATGVIQRESYERQKSRLIDEISELDDIDGILLDLHGAMLSENESDGEGALLRDVREIIGDKIPIVCVLDIHGNITDLKVKMSDAIVGYRTNPHVDLFERGRKAAKTILAIQKCGIKPVTRIKRLPMLGHNLGMSTWTMKPDERQNLPFFRIMEEVSELDCKPGIVDVSVFIGFAYADVPECVTTTLAITHDNAELAQMTADRVANRIWETRSDFLRLRPLIPVDEAVDRAMRTEKGPVVLVDVADNSGGGAPCDNTTILEALIRKGALDAVIPLRDPEAVKLAYDAGPGANIELDIGGKIDVRFYKPVRINATVKALTDGHYIIRGPHHGGYPTSEAVLPREAWGSADVGRTALLKTDGIEVIVSENRVGMERDYYKAVGVDPAERQIVVVKSAQAHRASFEGMARQIIEVDTPGSTSASYKGLIFKNVLRPIWPIDPL